MTELGSKSATNAEIVSFSGHAVNSPILQEYVMQTKETALNARRKMGNYLRDENRAKTSAERGVLQTPEGKTTNPMFSGEESGGSDGTRTRGLRRDRPDKSEE